MFKNLKSKQNRETAKKIVDSLAVKDPKAIFESLLKQASGTSKTRKVPCTVSYQIIAFQGIVDGLGTSTLVANLAIALADIGLTVCVLDTSVLAPVQDILLDTSVSKKDFSVDSKQHTWFDMPYIKESPLHISSYNKNISVLSFKNRDTNILGLLTSQDDESLVELAYQTLEDKFDLILVDCGHELSRVNTACLQKAHKIIQVWNDSPLVLGNVEEHLANSLILSISPDRMRDVVLSKLHAENKDKVESIVKGYKCNVIAYNLLSEEVSRQAMLGKPLYQLESKDTNIELYTQCIINIAASLIDETNEEEVGGNA